MRKFKNLLVGILLLSSFGVLAQTKPVTGKVTDANGAPVPGPVLKLKAQIQVQAQARMAYSKLMFPPTLH